jgi:hypothetical protein
MIFELVFKGQAGLWRKGASQDLPGSDEAD